LTFVFFSCMLLIMRRATLKKTSAKKLFLALVFSLLALSCSGGGGGSDDYGTPPRINNIYFAPEDNWDGAVTVLSQSERYVLLMWATDPDLDMVDLCMTDYVLPQNMPYDTYCMAMPMQVSEEVFYFFVDQNTGQGLDFSFLPAGEYRVEFQITDLQGNNSNLFNLTVYVVP